MSHCTSFCGCIASLQQIYDPRRCNSSIPIQLQPPTPQSHPPTPTHNGNNTQTPRHPPLPHNPPIHHPQKTLLRPPLLPPKILSQRRSKSHPLPTLANHHRPLNAPLPAPRTHPFRRSKPRSLRRRNNPIWPQDQRRTEQREDAAEVVS